MKTECPYQNKCERANEDECEIDDFEECQDYQLFETDRRLREAEFEVREFYDKDFQGRIAYLHSLFDNVRVEERGRRNANY